MNELTAVIVPCYNEAVRFESKYFKSLAQINGTHWYFVNDGSTDSTGTILNEFCSSVVNATCINIQVNKGKSHALSFGIKYVLDTSNRFSWIGILDSDGAFSRADVTRIINLARSKKLNKIDAVYGARVKLAGREICRNRSRHYSSRIITTFFGLLWKDIPYDTQTGLKIYSIKILPSSLFVKPFKTKWFFDIEIHQRINIHTKYRFKVWEEPLNAWKDVSGSKITPLELPILMKELTRITMLLLKSHIHWKYKVSKN
jgi:glycosyltransferase involved in cell wall biosynthesis